MTFIAPGLPAYQSSDAALAKWAQAVNAAIQAMGKAGLVTTDDLAALASKYGLDVSSKRVAAPGDVSIDLGNGVTGSISIAELAGKLVKNQQFKDALPKATSTTTTTQQNDNAVNDLEARLTLLINELSEQVNTTSAETRRVTAGIERGPVMSAVNNSTWSEELAARAIWNLITYGNTHDTRPYGKPPEQFLVTGDRVMFSMHAQDPPYDTHGAWTYQHTRQYIKGLGWRVQSGPLIAFPEVQNLDNFFQAVYSVLPEWGQIRPGTVIAGTGMLTGTAEVIMNPTLQDVLNQFNYQIAGTQAYSTLQQLQNFQNRINALEARGTTGGSRQPITNGFGQLPFDALGNHYGPQWHDSVASWCVLYRLYNGQLPAFYDPMPTTWLIPGDRCRLTDAPGGGTGGPGTFDETRSWTGSAWV